MARDSPINSFSPSASKRRRTLSSNPIETNRREEKEEAESKGKEAISDSDSMSSYCCGICLSDSGKVSRGEIDSCNHYFCFVCIMEWAKVESRCPMCKRRFTTIRRPPKHGVFPSERVVNVPKRDQVYHLFGNSTIGPFDPLAQVQCSVCHGGADESLLLLCDLCDSAAHTYCVGLGTTMPEGDWFCHDCAVSRTEHDNIQKGNDGDSKNVYVKSDVTQAAEPHVSTENFDVMAAAEADVSIFYIIRESDNPDFVRQQAEVFPSVLHGSQPCLSGEVIGPVKLTPQTKAGENTPEGVVDKATQTGARTLSRCRSVHGYIRALRENWNALRNGSLSFSSSSVESSSKNNENHNIVAVMHDGCSQPHPSSSTSGQQLNAQDGFTGIIRQDRYSCDVDKAWKMMDRAKSMQHAHERNKSVNLSSKCPSSKGTASLQATNRSLHLSKTQQIGTRESANTTSVKQFKHSSLEKETGRYVPLKLEKQMQRRVASKEILVESSECLPSTHTPRFFAALSSSKVQTSCRDDACHENGTRHLKKNAYGSSLDVNDEQNRSSCLITLVRSQPGASNSLDTKPDFFASSSYAVSIPEQKVRLVEGCTESRARKGDNAKSEIQSLVKLNLKLLSKDKKLGVDAFKEVARLATHTILAACGLGHSRYAINSFHSSVCSHSEQIQQLHKSTLMPNSCRECFYIYVKDVVNSILSQKVCHAKS